MGKNFLKHFKNWVMDIRTLQYFFYSFLKFLLLVINILL